MFERGGGRITFPLIILFFILCPSTFAITGAECLSPSFWFPVEDEIRSGHPLTGLTVQLFQILFSRFDPEEIGYFNKISSLFTPKKYLIIQEYKIRPNKGSERLKIKVYCPVTALPFQKILWQSQSSNSSDARREDGCYLFSSGMEQETRMKICSIVICKFFDFGHNNFPLPKNVMRTSFTGDISKEFNFLSDIEEFIAFFGTFSPNSECLPIQYILLDPINIDCTEFSTLAFEFLSDKGFDVRYSLGIMASNFKENYGGFHCWNSMKFEGGRIEIDPTLGRKIGRLAYHCHFPIQIDFADFASLEELAGFPISFTSLNGVDLKGKVEYNSRLTVYELNFGGEL